MVRFFPKKVQSRRSYSGEQELNDEPNEVGRDTNDVDDAELAAQLSDGSLDPDEVDPLLDPSDEGADDET